jgi:DNA modification methylase
LADIGSLHPLGRGTRKHSARQISKVAASLQRFGCVIPVLIDAHGGVVAGWAVVLAARQLRLSQIPAITITDLSATELRALRLALNRIAEDATWDQKNLGQEITEILEVSQDVLIEHLGFETGELDYILVGDGGLAQEDDLPQAQDGLAVITRKGDLWKLGEHLLLCGDALAAESYGHLLGADKAQMAFTDPPYNVGIKGNVSGLGKVKHADFVMASGELSRPEFAAFLQTALGHAAAHSVEGAVHFVCCDWRHIAEMLAAGGQVYGERLNLCVWNKSNGGMGTLYRSKHELVFVHKVGKGPHINNVALGKYGRNRTNVWDYVSQNALNGTSKSKLSLHPTVKPVAMVADAICDCSHRGGLVVDPFGGAGTTLIAAERTGRRGRLIELDPKFVDVSVERWQRLTGGTAVHAETGKPFAGMAALRKARG